MLAQSTGAAPRLTAPAGVTNEPSLSIVTASSGVLVRNLGPNASSVDFGLISYPAGSEAPGANSRENRDSMVISTRFGLRVNCLASALSRADISVFLMESSQFRVSIDGVAVSSEPQLLLVAQGCGSITVHKLEIEVPVYASEGSLLENIGFLLTS